MRIMIFVSLILNLAVLIPVGGGLVFDATWVNDAYGSSTAARQILLAVYLAIALVSALLLIRPDPRMVASLLVVQIVYKLITPLTVGNLENPVVMSNIGIGLVHAATLTLIWRNGVLAVVRTSA